MKQQRPPVDGRVNCSEDSAQSTVNQIFETLAFYSEQERFGRWLWSLITVIKGAFVECLH